MSLDSLDATLPVALGVFPGVSLTGRYVLSDADHTHAGHGLKGVCLPDGRVLVAVADTGFRGAPAAVATARLLAVLRGQLDSGSTLVHALSAVDRYAAHSLYGSGATMAVALMSQESGDTEIGVAGHSAPLLIPVSGRVAPVVVDPSRPLGLSGRAATGRCHLDRGDALLLHTAGLVTARDGAVSDGSARLREVIAALSLGGRSGPEFGDLLSDAVLTAMQKPRGYVDDVALLVAQRAAPPAPFHQVDSASDPADPRGRRLFAAWLDTLGVGLVDHLALSNAMEEIARAFRAAGRTGQAGSDTSQHTTTVEVDASLTPSGQVEVQLRSATTWRPETPHDQRALVVAGGLVASLTLHHHRDSTEVVLRQDVGRPVPLLASGVASRRTGEALPQPRGRAGFRVETVPEGLRFVGAIEVQHEHEFRELIHEATYSGTRSAVVDLTEVSRLCGPAVRVLFDYLNRAVSSAAELTVLTTPGGAPDQVLTQAAFPHRHVG